MRIPESTSSFIRGLIWMKGIIKRERYPIGSHSHNFQSLSRTIKPSFVVVVAKSVRLRNQYALNYSHILAISLYSHCLTTVFETPVLNLQSLKLIRRRR